MGIHHGGLQGSRQPFTLVAQQTLDLRTGHKRLPIVRHAPYQAVRRGRFVATAHVPVSLPVDAVVQIQTLGSHAGGSCLSGWEQFIGFHDIRHTQPPCVSPDKPRELDRGSRRCEVVYSLPQGQAFGSVPGG